VKVQARSDKCSYSLRRQGKALIEVMVRVRSDKRSRRQGKALINDERQELSDGPSRN
jgi:hypothetical protein